MKQSIWIGFWVAAVAAQAEATETSSTSAGVDPHSGVAASGDDVAEDSAAHAHSALSKLLPLPGGLELHGRFDVNYERRDYQDNPFDAAKDSFRNYHHFIFLTREAKGDPLGINLELVDLSFYEMSYRFNMESWPVSITAKAGKLIVPFGPEPLFHKEYGGLGGFDQQILPIIWARHGFDFSKQYRGGHWTLSNDLYLVEGHRLKQADDVLSLQSDLSGTDDFRFAAGDRIGFAWNSLTAWYSVYFSDLGFKRRLLLQALDVMIWRYSRYPVLRDLAFGVGLLRGDIFGGDASGAGGPGRDYYHFGTYFKVRYQITPWLYAQYRQGLRTSNNRRGLYRDETRLDVDDSSAHNLMLNARYHGLTVALAHYWRLEMADEIANDFLRLTVAYEF